MLTNTITCQNTPYSKDGICIKMRREDLVNEKELERKIKNAMSELLSFMDYDGIRQSNIFSP